MKEILKTLSQDFKMRYDKVFNSKENKEIRQRLVPELLRLLKPRYNPSYSKLKGWLHSLHKHRRDGYLLMQKGAHDKANRRVHNNNRVVEV